jgi:hypothetical protein
MGGEVQVPSTKFVVTVKLLKIPVFVALLEATVAKAKLPALVTAVS